jgi:hypothetical protein
VLQTNTDSLLHGKKKPIKINNKNTEGDLIWSGVTNISKKSKDITGLLPLAQTSRRVNLIMIHVHFCRNGDIRGQSLGS